MTVHPAVPALVALALDASVAPELRDQARTLGHQLPGWRSAYLPALARCAPAWRPRRSGDPTMNRELLRRLAWWRGMEAV